MALLGWSKWPTRIELAAVEVKGAPRHSSITGTWYTKKRRENKKKHTRIVFFLILKSAGYVLHVHKQGIVRMLLFAKEQLFRCKLRLLLKGSIST